MPTSYRQGLLWYSAIDGPQWNIGSSNLWHGEGLKAATGRGSRNDIAAPAATPPGVSTGFGSALGDLEEAETSRRSSGGRLYDRSVLGCRGQSGQAHLRVSWPPADQKPGGKNTCRGSQVWWSCLINSGSALDHDGTGLSPAGNRRSTPRSPRWLSCLVPQLRYRGRHACASRCSRPV